MSPHFNILDTKLKRAELRGQGDGRVRGVPRRGRRDTGEPESLCAGKAANRTREQGGVTTVERCHGGGVTANAAYGVVSFSESSMHVTLKGVGRIQTTSPCASGAGKVVHERFSHKGSTQVIDPVGPRVIRAAARLGALVGPT